MKRKKEKSARTVNTTKSLITGSLIATFIALTPFFFTLYESVPQQQVWDTFLFSYDSKFWEDAQYAMWVFTGKLIPLMLLFIWFFTCRHWWYHALLVPIAMYTFQIFSAFNDESAILEEFQLVYLLPIMLFVIPSIYLIKAKLFNKLNDNKSLQELEEEFILRPKNLLDRFKDYF